ncbi:hypothetical protein HPB47_015862, partial [Ixodes persulcatus]
MNTAEDIASGLLRCTVLCGIKVRAYEPLPRYCATGVIRDVDTTLTDEEIANNLRSPENRAKVQRSRSPSVERRCQAATFTSVLSGMQCPYSKRIHFNAASVAAMDIEWQPASAARCANTAAARMRTETPALLTRTLGYITILTAVHESGWPELPRKSEGPSSTAQDTLATMTENQVPERPTYAALTKKLKLRIAQLTVDAATYAANLTGQNWNTLCDKLNGTLGTARAWSLLRHLIQPGEAKSDRAKGIYKLLHATNLTDSECLTQLRQRYLPPPDTPRYADYTSPPNNLPYLNAPITDIEIRAALTDIRRNTSPGPDKIRYSLLYNLSDSDTTQLTTYLNEVWESGTLTKEWKEATVVLIPKPGEPLSLENLRPISLTSYLKGAFGNLSHDLVLEQLAAIGCGAKVYNYIRNFLRDGSASLVLGHLRSPSAPVANRGTPQGSALSPLLFNLAMRGLPPLLDEISDVRHALYADDITVWVTTGSLGHIETQLQEAATTIEQYARPRGQTDLHLTITLDDKPVPRKSAIRVLGFTLQSNAMATQTLHQLTTQCNQIMHMLYAASLTAEMALTRQMPYAFHRLLERLGVTNTLEELIEAHEAAQLARLRLTAQGQSLLATLGFPPCPASLTAAGLSPTARAKLTVAPIPRHMHPTRHSAG